MEKSTQSEGAKDQEYMERTGEWVLEDRGVKEESVDLKRGEHHGWDEHYEYEDEVREEILEDHMKDLQERVCDQGEERKTRDVDMESTKRG